MATERIRGIQVHRPIIYGSHARLLTDEERATAPTGHTHRWTVFLTSAASPPPPQSSSTMPPPVDINYLPGGADDLSYLIKRVTFRLHETYANANRVCDKPPYRVSETGWGEFVVQIKVNFVPESAEKTLALQHGIKLHHWGELIDEPAPAAAVPAAPAGTAEDAAPAGNDVKMEVDEAGADKEAQETAATTPATTPAGGPGADAAEPPADVPVRAAPPPVSIAASLPVHAWQYDELVFSDPPSNFLELLNEHPATPLPPRNRRARDQREEHELKTGKKRKGAGGAGRGRTSVSRAPTEMEPPTPATPATPTAPAPTVPPPGILGEPGSADVPLEYSVEMEKGEWNRLNDVRISIVEQMDRWRERLIIKEKELAKLKEELA
ncbi:NuA4 histone H4 acetyltransferase complex and the SWR1 complex subunit [Cryptotrichosporon argae]